MTPLKAEEWESMLACHLQSAKKNMKSVAIHPEVVAKYIQDEVQAGRVLGPLTAEEAEVASWHISKFGVIPKRTAGA